MKSITKLSSFFLTALFIIAFTVQSSAASTKVDILFMNHGPMRPTVAKVKELLTGYGDSVDASWHDVDQRSGKTFMKEQKIHGHIPMLIMINGQSEFSIEGRPVTLQGFPTGASPFKRVEGNWSVDDLKILLDKETGR